MTENPMSSCYNCFIAWHITSFWASELGTFFASSLYDKTLLWRNLLHILGLLPIHRNEYSWPLWNWNILIHRWRNNWCTLANRCSFLYTVSQWLTCATSCLSACNLHGIIFMHHIITWGLRDVSISYHLFRPSITVSLLLARIILHIAEDTVGGKQIHILHLFEGRFCRCDGTNKSHRNSFVGKSQR